MAHINVTNTAKASLCIQLVKVDSLDLRPEQLNQSVKELSLVHPLASLLRACLLAQNQASSDCHAGSPLKVTSASIW